MAYSFYDAQLTCLKGQVERKRHLESMLESLHGQERQLTEQVFALEKRKQAEQADVERLEYGSLAAFYYAVIGKKEQRLSKERAEAMAAAVRYDAAAKALAAARQQIGAYEGELGALDGCQARYDRLLSEKMAAVKASGGSAAARMLELEESIAFLDCQIREIDEAVDAGLAAEATAAAVLDKLSSARSWGTWDLLGGGLVADLLKHDHLDSAQQGVEQLQAQLASFRTELADVAVEADLQVNIEGFLRFADIFFDDLFADWTVMDRIDKSLARMDEVKSQISQLLTRLADLREQAEGRQAESRTRLEQLTLNA